MVNISLEQFYIKIDKNILLTQSYSGCDSLYFIIKSCRLKPLILQKNIKSLHLYRDWFDEYRSTLNINNKKKITIINNDLTINNFNCTDIYYGLTIDKIFLISKLAYIEYGFCEETNRKNYIITLLGIDNYFRTFVFDGSWKKTSTLILGLEKLQFIANRLDINQFIAMNKGSAIPMLGTGQYLTNLPLNSDLESFLNKDHEFLVNSLRKK